MIVSHVEVTFRSPENLEFTDDDYQFFGDGNIERGKRNVEAAIEKLARRIDRLVSSEFNE